MSFEETPEVSVDASQVAPNVLQQAWAAFETSMASIKAPVEKIIADLIAGLSASSKESTAPKVQDRTPFASSRGYGADLKDFF